MLNISQKILNPSSLSEEDIKHKLMFMQKLSIQDFNLEDSFFFNLY